MSSESILKIYPELDSVAFPLLLQTLFKTLSLVQTFSDLHHGLYSSVMVYLHLFLIQCQSEVTKMSVKLFHFFVQTFFYLTYKAHMLYHLPFHLYSILSLFPHLPSHSALSPRLHLLLVLLLSRFSRVQLCATPETTANQAPPSLGFSRQEHWSGLPFPSPMHESEK